MSFIKNQQVRIRNYSFGIVGPLVGIGLALSGYYLGLKKVQSNGTEAQAKTYVSSYSANSGESKGFSISKEAINELHDWNQDTSVTGFQIYYGSKDTLDYFICVPLLPSYKEMKAPANDPNKSFIPIVLAKKVGNFEFARPCPQACDKSSRISNN